MTLEAWVNPTALGDGLADRDAQGARPAALAYALYAHDGAGRDAGHAYTGAERGVATPGRRCR